MQQQPDAAIYTYIRSSVTGPFSAFVAKHGAAVRAPEWCLTPSEKRAIAEQERGSVMAAKQPKKGKAA